MNPRLTFISLVFLALFNQQGFSQETQSNSEPEVTASKQMSAAEKGLQIAQAVKANNIGWGDSEADMKMILRTKKGKEIVRQMRSKQLEVESDGDKGLTIFDTPANVKGTVFLSFSHTVDADDQWLYLPALKRVKRIASRNKSGPFLGSEFAFEDLSSFEVEKFTYKYLRDEEYQGLDMYVVEMRPVDKYSGYTRSQVWIDKEHKRFFKVVFYDRRDTLLKTLTIENHNLYLDKYWRASNQFMVNHKSGKSTDIEFTSYRFKVGLTDKDFNEKRLERIR